VKRKTKRRIKYLILLILLFFIFYFILEKVYRVFLYDKVKIDENGNNLVLLKNVFQGVLSFVLANIVNIARLRFDTWKENNKNIPYLHMSIVEASGIRRHLRRANDPEVIIGTGTYFIYVDICIENVGGGILENCKVANTQLKSIRLSNEGISNILLRIYVSECEKVDEILDVIFLFSDTRDRHYKKQFKIHLIANDKDTTRVEIVDATKQKRVRKW